MKYALCLAVLCTLLFSVGCATQQGASSYAQWPNGPSVDEDFFPIMVWAQDVNLAPRYQAIGVNAYMALWEGPTEEQLAVLKKHGMRTICEQNEVGLAHIDDPVIIGWMHSDEPDNKQGEDGKAVSVEEVMAEYKRIKANDPTRPVIINLGQGVANEEFAGRGVGYNVYPEYIKAADIVCYDVYPVSNFKSSDADGETVLREDGVEHLYLVARGLERLKKWSGGTKPLYNVLECTHIHNPVHKPTPHQVRAEVWMSLIHGSKGIVWFAHQWKPTQDVARLLADDEMREAVSEINHQILRLAPALNSPDRNELLQIEGDKVDVPVAAMVKQQGDATYIFAVPMRPGKVTARFYLDGSVDGSTVEVVDEDRQLEVKDGMFSDNFEQYEVHIYKVAGRSSGHMISRNKRFIVA